MNMSYISSNSIEICSPDRVDIPNGWEAPAPNVQPVLPLRLYVPELEEIRISPVVARKGNQLRMFFINNFFGKLQDFQFNFSIQGYLNVLEHGGSGWKKRWVVSIFSKKNLHFKLK